MSPRMSILGALTTLLLLAPTGSMGGVAGARGWSPSPAAPDARPSPRWPVEGVPQLGGSGRFRWPVDGVPRPVRRFDPPPRPWLAGHRGVDLLAPAAATIRAAGTGTVLFAGMVADRPVVTVGHVDGLRTTYEPVRPTVTVGAVVSAGTPLGNLLPGHAGCPAVACLHWGLRRGEGYLDPLALLGLGRVRLLPVGDLTVSRARSINAGRADRATRTRVAGTPRACCRPGRTGAASRGRPRS
ncbi:peptidoglycan DD-metalloendopeptidase family protein [Verrucosispora sp. WMMA2044]|uniref:peptidoglycan DD-metalloendopeptidase family protein n=1 Tax=Verrucosispora sp. WMMA2044 TaxID=3016419 RepID=UPI00248BC0B6|nr:peptidoglycan DD-metalloendopeptidase family protein [Verrucosispora sp. WMMA2044]WBB47116.1 peptidoglycan DD-metalloendopeptidase family protein [Verrucosispora sp. WMMA2044]